MQTIDLELMKWPIIKQTLEDGYTSVVIPVGADTNDGAEALAKEAGKTMLAPFLITMALKPQTLKDLLEDYIDGYVHHGYKKITVVMKDRKGHKEMTDTIEKAKAKYKNTEIVSYSLDMKDNAR